MGEGLGGTPELHGWADIVAALEAEVARFAGLADFQGDAVSNSEGRDAGSDGGDDTGGFMAQRQGFANEDIAIAEVGVIVQVGATEPGSLNCDLDFAG